VRHGSPAPRKSKPGTLESRATSLLAETIVGTEGHRRDALHAIRAALEGSDPRRLVRRALTFDGDGLSIGGRRYPLDDYRKITVVGAGKASGLMAAEVELILGDRIDGGIVIVPETQGSFINLKRIRVEKSSHPLPARKGVLAARRALKTLDRVGRRDLVIFLFSGGGSSLMPLPASGITLEELRTVTTLLLNSGADIDEINCVRKHISRIAGGRLVERTSGEAISLIVSDVVGDNPASVASGPTVPDPTTFRMARDVLERHEIWGSLPLSVKTVIQSGVDGRIKETPKPGDPAFARVHSFVIGSNSDACMAAQKALEDLGYQVKYLKEPITGEARFVGKTLVGLSTSNTSHGKWAVVAGGETTVTVRGRGKGGRNQELALSAALTLKGERETTLVSFATDGIDGPTEAAGAIADTSTCKRAGTLGLNPSESLKSNDSYTFFRTLRDLIVTGPTGTNVNDLVIALGGAAADS